MVIVGDFQLKSPVLFDSNLVQPIPFHSKSLPFLSFPSLSLLPAAQSSRSGFQHKTTLFFSIALSPGAHGAKPEVNHPQPQIKSALLKFQLPPTASQSPEPVLCRPRCVGCKKKAFMAFIFSGRRRKCSEF